MLRTLLILALCALSPVTARAGFTLVTDPAALGANDSASWPRISGATNDYRLSPTLTSLAEGAVVHVNGQGHSNPSIDTTFIAPFFGDLFIGTVASGHPGDTASIQLDFTFDPNGPAVLGIGATLDGVNRGDNPFRLLTAVDIEGNSQTFDLGTSFDQEFIFRGILSDIPLASLDLFSSDLAVDANGTETTLRISNLSLDVATPTPSAWALLLSGVLTYLAARACNWCQNLWTVARSHGRGFTRLVP